MAKERTDADVIVIGAGVVGASIAYELSTRGVSVIVVESGSGVGNGCSYANAGLLAPSHVEPLTTPANVRSGFRYMFQPKSPFLVHPKPRLIPWFARFVAASGPRRAREISNRMQEMAAQSLQLHHDYARAGLKTGFRAGGSLDVYSTRKRFEAACRSLVANGSHPRHVILTPREAYELEPALGQTAGAIHRLDEAQCESQSFVHATLSAAESHGARIYWNTKVDALTVHRDRIEAVETDSQRFRAEHYIVAAGLGSEKLCRGVGIKMPMEAGKGYVVDLDVDGSVPQIPLTLKERKVVVTPYPDRLRLSGTFELGSGSRALSRSRIQAILDAGHSGMPRVKIRRTIQVWAGQRPCTADGVPSLGRSKLRSNLLVTAGHGMWGLVLAPITGRLIAQDICEGSPEPDDWPFSPDRFGAMNRAHRTRPKRQVPTAA
ncbi:NAD(P)/FAD-dependent oxidoreductase [Arthrobacter pigmenti]